MNSPSGCPAGLSRSCRVSESRRGAPLDGGNVGSAVLRAVGPVLARLGHRTARLFDHQLQGRLRCARPPRRRPADLLRPALCPRVGTIQLSARFVRAGSACVRSIPNVPPTTSGRGCLRLVEAGTAPSLPPLGFGPHGSWTSRFHLPTSLGSTGVTPLHCYYGRSDSRRAALRATGP